MEGKKLVTPGEMIVKGMDYLPGDGTYRSGPEIRANILGLAHARDRLVKVIPLSGKYMPKRDDPVIGIVTEVRYSNWTLDIKSPYDAMMMIGEATDRFIDLKKDRLTNYFNVGDAVICKIIGIDDGMGVMVTTKGPGLRKLVDGRLVSVQPSKIPRIIGKNASMIKMIKEYTGSKLFVGQNGRIWISGGNEELVLKVIRRIESEAHMSGLTDAIKKMLEDEGNGNQA
jgi:exosome complex component RRP4